jgi:hypothetical protein
LFEVPIEAEHVAGLHITMVDALGKLHCCALDVLALNLSGIFGLIGSQTKRRECNLQNTVCAYWTSQVMANTMPDRDRLRKSSFFSWNARTYS